MAKTFIIHPQGQKLVLLDKEYLPSVCTSDANVLMKIPKEAIPWPAKEFPKFSILAKLLYAKNVPYLILIFIWGEEHK